MYWSELKVVLSVALLLGKPGIHFFERSSKDRLFGVKSSCDPKSETWNVWFISGNWF